MFVGVVIGALWFLVVFLHLPELIHLLRSW